jgi:hypothetical protein
MIMRVFNLWVNSPSDRRFEAGDWEMRPPEEVDADADAEVEEDSVEW